MSLNDAVHWSTDLGGGTTVALVQAGTFLTDAGAIFGPVPRLLWERHVAAELTADHRLIQALNCLLIETPAGRVLVETGIGERADDKLRTSRGYEGDAVLPALRRAGFDPASVDVVALSHLHFDHAGGLLDAAGSRAFPRATIVAQRAEWEIALGDNPRLVASYDQPELRLARDWGAEGWADGEREVLPGVSVIPTGGHSAGHQGIVVRGAGSGREGVGVLRRPGHAAVERQPEVGDGVRRLPARLGPGQGRAVRPGRRRGLDDRPVARARPPGRAAGGRPRPVRVRAGLGQGAGDSASRRWRGCPPGAPRHDPPGVGGRIASTSRPPVGRHRAEEDLADAPVRPDEHLGRQAVDPVQVEDVGRQVGGDRVADRVLGGVGATSAGLVSWTLIPIISRPRSLYAS